MTTPKRPISPAFLKQIDEVHAAATALWGGLAPEALALTGHGQSQKGPSNNNLGSSKRAKLK